MNDQQEVAENIADMFERHIASIVEKLNEKIKYSVYYSGNLVFAVRINLYSEIENGRNQFTPVLSELKGELQKNDPRLEITSMVSNGNQWLIVNFGRIGQP